MEYFAELHGHTGTVRTAALGHLRVPVVALQESVIHACNASVPEFVPMTTLAEAPHRWENLPVTLGHPKRDGQQISANDPAILAAQSFGKIIEARVLGTKLLMTLDIDPFRATKVGAGRLLARLRNRETCEVSIGAFVVTDSVAGVYDGQPFGATWKSLTPDHIALLEHTVGACSCASGCGTHRAAAAAARTWEDLLDFYEPLDGYQIALDMRNAEGRK